MNYLLLGAGKTSIECLKALIKLKKRVSICLNKDELVKIKEYYTALDDVIVFENFYKVNFAKFDYIVRSPGLSALNPYIKYLKTHNIKMINEMELAYILSNKKGYYIGITGSNGKTTTVSLLYECIKKQTNNVILAGNVGIPLISLLDKINNYTIVILEMSSFQLEEMHELKFDISCILNLSVNHLDSVPNVKYYYNSKFNITNLQNSDDYLVIDSNDQEIVNILRNSCIKANVIDYSSIVLKMGNVKLKGEHNKKNIRAVLAILGILGLDIDTVAIKQFNPLEYRLQEKMIKNNILVVNDSKSTSAESLRQAIETYNHKNIVLIFGGKNKGGNFNFLNSYNLKKKICFGSLSEEIIGVNLDYKNFELDGCVEYALNNANNGDVILFSCGCASFDLYKNYKERGKAFDKKINEN